MKVAIVLNTSWNIYNFRMNLIKSLIKGGYEVHTIAPKDDYIINLTAAGCIHHHVRMDSRGANPLFDLALLAELWWKYRLLKPDAILHFTIKPNIYGTLAASMLHIPTINNVCGLGTVFLKKGIVNKVALLLYKLAFRFPTKVFFQNPDDLKLFLEKKLVKKEVGALVPGSGIDLVKFSPQPFTRNNPFTFLMISRLLYDKGVAEYMQAIHILRATGLSARFQLLGAKDPEHKRGIALETIDAWIRSGVVEYLGTTDDVRPYIAKADCIVLPSYREGTPRVLLEAAAMQKPAIATDVPGCRQVVQDHVNGLLCAIKNPADLAAKMHTILELDNAILVEMGKNGRMKVEQSFHEEIVSRLYLEALQDLSNRADRAQKPAATAWPIFSFTPTLNSFTKNFRAFTKNSLQKLIDKVTFGIKIRGIFSNQLRNR